MSSGSHIPQQPNTGNAKRGPAHSRSKAVAPDHVARHRRERVAINAAAQLFGERAASNALDSAERAQEARSKSAQAKKPIPSSRKETQRSDDGAKSAKDGKRRWPGNILRIILALFAIAALILLCTETWLFNNWSALSVDEILYHLRASLSGTNTSTIVDYVLHYGIIEVLGAAAIIAALVITRRRFSLKIQRIAMAVILAFGIGAAAFAVHDFDARVGAFDYFAQLTQRTGEGAQGENADFIGENYVDPATAHLDFPQRKRNLVFIYLESMELTFADEAHGGAFEQNVIPELCVLAEEGECFAGAGDGASTQTATVQTSTPAARGASAAAVNSSPDAAGSLNGGHALPGTTWTTGAMFGSTSGVPLKLPFNSAELESGDDFFPALSTLGDILADEGYAQELLIGSEAAFGGRDLYYGTHGDFKIADYNYAVANGMIPKDYFVWWGYEDRKLFSFAQDELSKLAAGDQPFNLTMLTVDTHFPDGWLCPLCRKDFDDQYSNAYACSSRQVIQFVRWIQKQDFYDDTTIVIVGDHPTMDADYCATVPASYDRRVYTAIINPATSTLTGFDSSKRREYSTLDLFPTTLTALGTGIEGDRLGLGTNLFSDRPTIVEIYGLDACEKELEKPSAFLESFSDAQITAKHMADAAKRDWIDVSTGKDGTLTFTLVESALNASAVDDVKITVLDERTGFSRALPTVMTTDKTDPNYFYYSVHTDLTEADLPHIGVSASMSAGRFKNYPICTLDPGQLAPEDEAEDENVDEDANDDTYEGDA